jgi:hypothetical protein
MVYQQTDGIDTFPGLKGNDQVTKTLRPSNFREYFICLSVYAAEWRCNGRVSQIYNKSFDVEVSLRNFMSSAWGTGDGRVVILPQS